MRLLLAGVVRSMHSSSCLLPHRGKSRATRVLVILGLGPKGIYDSCSWVIHSKNSCVFLYAWHCGHCYRNGARPKVRLNYTGLSVARKSSSTLHPTRPSMLRMQRGSTLEERQKLHQLQSVLSVEACGRCVAQYMRQTLKHGLAEC